MNESEESNGTSPSHAPDRLTVFTFLWACQAMVHQEFYSKWLKEGNVFGWLLTIAALAVLLKPRSLILFSAMLTTSVIYNVLKWPFVVNHILMETIVNLTVLASIVTVTVFDRKDTLQTNEDQRNHIYDHFAPVVTWMLIIMYYFAFIAKLNYDFIDPQLSCVATMYEVLVQRFPFVPTDPAAKVAAIWATILIEAAIPLLLTFRRTRYLGVAIGLPFHLMLGLVGHRTFSALAYALYALFLMEPLTVLLGQVAQRLIGRVGRVRYAQLTIVVRVAVALGVALLIGADVTGHYQSGIGPFLIYRVAWVVWILWCLVIIALYFGAMVLRLRRRDMVSSAGPTAAPKFLWAMLLLVVLNGMSQYLGLKTETCFTMYSNLRTEGHVNNHMFMPAFRLVGYQDDLVEVIKTDHPDLTRYVDEDLLLTYFEFRRILSETQQDCFVTFRRNGIVQVFHRQGQQCTHPELIQKHPIWLAKLLYFRPVPKGDRMPCQH